MGADSLVTVYSDPAIHSRSGLRAACRTYAPRLPSLPAARAVWRVHRRGTQGFGPV